MGLMTDLSTSTANPPHIATQQEKLDALFGITGGKDVDSFLDGLSLSEAEQIKEDALSSID